MITLAMVLTLAIPPAPYDHEPVRVYSVQHVPPAEIRKYCRPEYGWIIVGCTVLDRYILLRNDLTPEAAAHVLRHEIGHVNGWEHY